MHGGKIAKLFLYFAMCLKYRVPVLILGNRIRKSSSGCNSVSIHSEDFRNRQQHQKAKGGNHKGTSKSTQNYKKVEFCEQLELKSNYF